MEQLTPMMRQYLEVHEKVKDAILFFRLGDFYEMFFDDAITASRELDITLTGRECGLDEKAPMCGVPYHAAESYIAKLIEKGYKVAICEQVEDPKEAKGIVKRDIVRVLSPGTMTEGKYLKEHSNNYLMSICGNVLETGIAYVDLSTGEFYVTQFSIYENKGLLLDEIAKINPSELLMNTVVYKDKGINDALSRTSNGYINVLPNRYFELERSKNRIAQAMSVYSVHSLGLENRELAMKAAGALLAYIEETQMQVMQHVNALHYYDVGQFMALDHATRSNLELTKTIRGGEKKGSLLGLLDKTRTSMGSRKLKQWLDEPLTDAKKINLRLEAVEILFDQPMQRDTLKNRLEQIYDLKRLVGKMSMGTCNAKDLLALKDSIYQIPPIKEVMLALNAPLWEEMIRSLDDLGDIGELLERSIDPDPPLSVKEGNMIRDGYHEEVDHYREITTDSKNLLLKMEQREREKSGIRSLKIKYNKVFGYYIEVTNSNLSSVPPDYIRKQTLANSERYFTPELKELENSILEADQKLEELEYILFQEIRSEILKSLDRIKTTAEIISQVDVLYALAQVSFENNYIRPKVDESKEILIVEGRHPVVESMLENNAFVPNSVEVDTKDNRMIIITGPNMAGKSTYIRQIALIVLMAQTGCFVPAAQAKIGVVDRIFTRVGASDDLASGHSTFMVEMSEVSNILQNATKDSLVILDEVGRGTSTFDGLSIAWAVVEHLVDHVGCKTFFATHYHELTEMEEVKEGVRNYCIKVQERETGVLFLRKIVSGSADKSYGIEVAKLAGLPEPVIRRANELLVVLEQKEDKVKKSKSLAQTLPIVEDRVNLFNYKDKQIIEELDQLPLDEMTPMESMNYLYALKKRVTEVKE
ncbi:DNA mismatch repair protein MutS [Alkalibacter rhizosphaerae]|uniref:DNA mismatch repair protein MutS n=1 Tax=Alkalibacter rhizosphaerae TaxID=2815577 RepID=A0A974XIC5_9FIRM|nr:DNA mismatch repair protein MutS [Alkalibacter rhizosphaerae]QSX08898.1 DNA mismatch repair protein MutS [Alkalibacter rhizosphaerae]